MSWFLRGLDLVVRCWHEFFAIRCLNMVIAWQFCQNVVCVFDLVIVWIQFLLGSLFCATLLGKISFWSFWILFFIKSLFCATISRKDIDMEYWFLFFIKSLLLVPRFQKLVWRLKALNALLCYKIDLEFLIFVLYKIVVLCHDFTKDIDLKLFNLFFIKSLFCAMISGKISIWSF